MTRLFCLSFAVFLMVVEARANTLNYLGYGAQNQGMGNSTVALPTDAYSSSYNPALMALQPKSIFSVGTQGVATSFKPISSIVTDTPSLGASSVTTGDISTSSQGATLYTLGYQGPLWQGEHSLHFGFTIVAPFQRVFEINTPDAFQPQYSMYSADTQRLSPSVAFALALDDYWTVGVGGNFYIVQGSTSQQRLPTGGNSTSRLSTDVNMGVAPTVGLTYKLSDSAIAGLSYHGKEDYQSEIDINAQVGLLGASPLTFTNTCSIFYDPDTMLLGFSFKDESHDTFALSGELQLWNGYHGGAVTMNFQSYTGSFSQTLPDTPFHNTLSGHLGYQHDFPKSQMRAGYAFSPTPVPDPNKDQNSNILDSDKHELYLGWGKKWERLAFLDGTFSMDLVGFLDYLVPLAVVKTNSQAVGYPGYTIGGLIYGYGLTLTREY